LTITSRIGEGTTIKIKIPASELKNKPDETPYLESKKNTVVLPKGITILIVDDHQEMREYLCTILTGMNIIQAKNGIVALEKIKQHKIDFIITDYMMPQMNGPQFVEAMKSNNILIPVVILTARADDEAKLKLLRLGVDDYIVKPFNEQELLIRISNALNNSYSRKTYLDEEGSINTSSDDTFINNLIEYVDKCCSDFDFNLNMINDEFALSSSTLYRKVKSSTGMSPNDFVKEVRLQKARKIVESNSVETIKALTFSVGMNNSTYFSKLYLNRFGIDLKKVFI